MRTIEPCCARRQLIELRDSIKDGGTTQFQGYGDMSLTELLPCLLTRYTETELLIAAPAIPDQAAEVINRWMRQQWPHANGKDKLDTIARLTIVADLSQEKSPLVSEWMKDNPFAGRLTLVNRQQADTAILLPDIAITGPLNMRYGQNFVCTVTTVAEKVRELWMRLLKATKETSIQSDIKDSAAQTEKKSLSKRAARRAARKKLTKTPPFAESPSE